MKWHWEKSKKTYGTMFPSYEYIIYDNKKEEVGYVYTEESAEKIVFCVNEALGKVSHDKT